MRGDAVAVDSFPHLGGGRPQGSTEMLEPIGRLLLEANCATPRFPVGTFPARALAGASGATLKFAELFLLWIPGRFACSVPLVTQSHPEVLVF